jgi:hypothetical protein
MLRLLILSCFIFSHFLRVVHVNGVRSDNSENFVEARAIEVVDIDEAFEDVV